MWLKEELKKFKKEGGFQLSGGQIHNTYFDLKEAFGNPELLNCIANSLYGMVEKKPYFIAARGLGGIALATVISIRQGIKLTLIRDKQKEYGTKKIIEGYLPIKGESGIIVDDVLTTGKNIIESAREIEQCGAEVFGGYVVVRRSLHEIGIPVKHLFTLDELL